MPQQTVTQELQSIARDEAVLRLPSVGPRRFPFSADTIRAVQDRLSTWAAKQEGLDRDVGPAGTINDKTVALLRKFQGASGLKEDGELGFRTLAKLFPEYEEFAELAAIKRSDSSRSVRALKPHGGELSSLELRTASLAETALNNWLAEAKRDPGTRADIKAMIDKLKPLDPNDTAYDSNFSTNLKVFQIDHGLPPVGKVGPRTAEIMLRNYLRNVPQPEERLNAPAPTPPRPAPVKSPREILETALEEAKQPLNAQQQRDFSGLAWSILKQPLDKLTATIGVAINNNQAEMKSNFPDLEDYNSEQLVSFYAAMKFVAGQSENYLKLAAKGERAELSTFLGKLQPDLMKVQDIYSAMAGRLGRGSKEFLAFQEHVATLISGDIESVRQNAAAASSLLAHFPGFDLRLPPADIRKMIPENLGERKKQALAEFTDEQLKGFLAAEAFLRLASPSIEKLFDSGEMPELVQWIKRSGSAR